MNPNLTPTQILTWLNGRVVNDIRVIHEGKIYTLWNQDDAVDAGLTIEDAVAAFALTYDIDIEAETQVGNDTD